MNSSNFNLVVRYQDGLPHISVESAKFFPDIYPGIVIPRLQAFEDKASTMTAGDLQGAAGDELKRLALNILAFYERAAEIPPAMRDLAVFLGLDDDTDSDDDVTTTDDSDDDESDAEVDELPEES